MWARTSWCRSSQLLISSPLWNSMYGLWIGLNTRGCVPFQLS